MTGVQTCALPIWIARFRLTHIERDVFTPAAGYPADLQVDGIRALDRVWAALEVA